MKDDKNKKTGKKKNALKAPANEASKTSSSNGKSSVRKSTLQKQTAKNEGESDVICIIGMHRSGTSMVARLLNLCGLDIGPPEHFLEPNESNPLGYFENKDFTYKIDDALLNFLGGSWDNPPPFNKGWKQAASLAPIFEEARKLIKSFSTSQRWGWKDPRATILLPFWKSLIPNLRFVICIRSPVEVAKSLLQRDKMHIDRGVYLWHHYMHTAIQDTEGCPRMFVFYEDFFKDASLQVKRLAAFCGLRVPDKPSALHKAISKKLKHHKSETLELLNDNSLIAQHKLFYIGLRALTNQGFAAATPDGKIEDSISENISRFSKLLEQFHDEQKMAQLQSALTKLENEYKFVQQTSGNLERILADKEAHIHDLIGQTGKRERTIAELEKKISEFANHQAHLEHLISQKDDRITALTEETGSQKGVIEEKEKRI
ncbi:MAG: sulfotransferase, partial [Nitrospiria bacterium]